MSRRASLSTNWRSAGRSSRDYQRGEVVSAWIVVNVGCIECGVSTAIVGRFSSESAAQAIADRLGKSHNWREGGQNSFEVFPEPDLDVIADEYVFVPEPSPRWTSAACLLLMLSGCGSNWEPLTPEQMAESVETCDKLNLGVRWFFNGWTLKIVDAQCKPMSEEPSDDEPK